jgi:hypothetical protein
MFLFDPLYFIILAPALILTVWATIKVKSCYKRYSNVYVDRGIRGAEAAKTILSRNNLSDVRVNIAEGWLSDHYDPRSKEVRLSPDIYEGSSIAAVAVAAHEAGHAIQDATRYGPMALRHAAVPLASIGSNLSMILIFIGFLMGALGLAKLGVLLFSGVVLFQLLTLPVEFNASARAKALLTQYGLVTQREQEHVNKMLNAAAMTYVAAALTSILTLIYYLLRLGILGGRDE